MTNQIEDIQEIDFIFNVISREEWVDEEVILIYEDCYRRLKRLANEFNLDTSEIDVARKRVMDIYGEI
jgi:hypothetical protein